MDFLVPGILDNLERVLRFGGCWTAWYLGTTSHQVNQAVWPLLPALRSISRKVFVVGGHGGRSEGQKPYRSAEALQPASDSWECCEGPPLARMHSSAVAVGHHLYILGGRPGDHHSTASVERLDFYRNYEWECVPSLTSPRYSSAVVCLSGMLCILGGFDGVEALDSCEALKHKDAYSDSDSWCFLPPLPFARGKHTAVAVDGSVYLLGGMDSGYRSLDLASHTSFQNLPADATGAWTQLEPMHQARSGCAAAVVQRAIVVVGGVARGWTSLSSVERFQLQSRHWETLAPMSIIRRECAVVALAGELWVLGGASYGGRSSGQVEVLGDAEGVPVWRLGPSHTPRSGCTAALLHI